ncbi:unnamed protein product [Bursaphelenchus xylophilus]|uniref:(pine wood nematode) hypothetical protein n=1 Tax=Bursaphelenchus xylophilus TaxID=6326 RepID=A0A1I7RXR8_BURXY|nr:unnamed protein product [Bursaphelenchus xylophilus]CAG9126683.1 unnamed protein product [Bursaphelenchus xylophilus]
MELTRTTVHSFLDFWTGLLGIIACTLVIFLSITRVKNRALQVYSIMMVTTASVELAQAITTVATFTTGCFGNKIVFMLVDNPWYPKQQSMTYFAVGLQLFLMFLSVSMLPLQFVYRYGVMRGKPFTKVQLLGMFFISVCFAGLHGGLTPFTFLPASPKYDIALREALDAPPDQPLPGYLVGDVHEFNVMAAHFGNVLVIMASSYAVIIIMIILSKNTVTLKSTDSVSKQTQAVQRQVTQIIYLQALYPVIFVCLPCLLFPIYAVQGKAAPYVAEWAVYSMHTPPLINSLAVIMCVPSYRHFVSKPFRSEKVVSTSNS